jgi:hypothetical protein
VFAATDWGQQPGVRIGNTIDITARAASADYVLQLDQRFGAEQGISGRQSATQHMTGRRT